MEFMLVMVRTTLPMTFLIFHIGKSNKLKIVNKFHHGLFLNQISDKSLSMVSL
jgi:hypothetical protein